MRLFVSFSSTDRDLVRDFEQRLRARNPDVEVFLDERGLVGGVYWIPKLGEELGKADVVLLILGQTVGPWQELEYYEALQLKQLAGRKGRPRIVPLVISDRPSPGLAFLSTLHQIVALDLTSIATLTAVESALADIPMVEAELPWRRFQPYKGLPAFGTTDAAFFFGRENAVSEILDVLSSAQGRIVTLIGQSGVGKSSLIFAGVLARLKSQIAPVEGRSWPPALKDSRSYLQLTIRPGIDPLKELAVSLVRLYELDDASIDEQASSWTKRFRAGALLRDMFRLVRDKIAEKQGGIPPKKFVLYVDQAEELYTTASNTDAKSFSRLLAEAAREHKFLVLISLRSDFYPEFQNDAEVFALAKKVDVVPLASEALADVILKPAALLGVGFEDKNMPALMAEAAGRESGALPLLSDLLQEMWLSMLTRGDSVLRWSDQPGIVDITLPLSRRADAFLELPTTDKVVVRRLFTLRLAQIPLLGEPLRRRARRAECMPEEWTLAEQLASAEQRLLIISSPPLSGGPIVEVAHEQLLRRWPTLRAWLTEEREFLIWRTEMELATEAHEELAPVQKPEALLMGRRLTIAETWFAQRSDDLAVGVRKYIEASLSQRDRLIQLQQKSEAERVEMEKRYQAAALEMERLARAEAEKEKELEKFRADSAEEREAAQRELVRRNEDDHARQRAHDQSLLEVNYRIYRRTVSGLVATSILAVCLGLAGLFFFEQKRATGLALNETAVALSEAKLAQGELAEAAERASQAFENAPTVRSRSALFQATYEVSPYLERKISVDSEIVDMVWTDPGTIAVAQSDGYIRFFRLAGGQLPVVTAGENGVLKLAAAGQEKFTLIKAMKALSTGPIVIGLNNGAIEVLDGLGRGLASTKIKLIDDYSSDVRIFETGQNVAVAMFADAGRVRSLRCRIGTGGKTIACDELVSPAISRVSGFTVDRKGKRFFVARSDDSDTSATVVESYDENGHKIAGEARLEGVVSNLDLSDDDSILALSNNSRVQLLDARTMTAVPRALSLASDDGESLIAAITVNRWRPRKIDLPVSCGPYALCMLSASRAQQKIQTEERLDGHRATITHVAWDPSGKRLATRDVNGVLLIWSFDQSQDVMRDFFSDVVRGPIASLDISPKRDRVAFIGSTRDQVGLAEIEGTRVGSVRFLSAPGPVEALAFASTQIYAISNNQIAFGNVELDHQLKPVADTMISGSEPKILWSSKHDEIIFSDGDRIVCIAGDGALEPRVFESPKSGHGLFGFGIDNKRGQLLVSYRDGPLIAYDLARRSVVDVLTNNVVPEQERNGSSSLSTRQRGDLLAVSGPGKLVVVYDLAARVSSMKLVSQIDEVISVAFDPSGQKLAALGATGSLTLWDFSSDGAQLWLAAQLVPLRFANHVSGRDAQPNKIAWLDDNHLLVAGGILPPRVVSIREADWLKRISDVGYRLDK